MLICNDSYKLDSNCYTNNCIQNTGLQNDLFSNK